MSIENALDLEGSQSNRKKVPLNTLWLLLGRVLPQGLQFLFFILIARQLGEIGLGQISWLMALLAIGNAFSTFGIDTLLLRKIAAGLSDAAIFRASVLVQLGFAFLCILLAQIAAFLWVESTILQNGLRVVSLALLPMALTTAWGASLRAHERMELLLIGSVGTALVQLIGAILLLRQGAGVFGLVLFLTAVRIVEAGLYGSVHAWRIGRLGTPEQPLGPLVKSILQAGLPLGLLMVLAVTYQRLPLLITNGLGSEAETGYLSVAMRLIEGLRLFPYALYGALFPVLIRRFSKGEGRRKGIDLLFWQMLGGLIVLVGLLAYLSPWLIPLLFGNGYQVTVPLTQIMALSLIPFLFSLRYSVELIAAGHDRATGQTEGISLLASSACMLVGYQQAALPGLAWGAVISEVLRALLLYSARRRVTA